ncbi:hypothetical protein G4B88_017838 [Cannabis sativa]|uniref:Uncharacterized protein n=1 Tax=Cannabis sativa TaxID=3483 RepID=A0A7J6GQ72_CANSA|nr:hypothetical protein G4B88_017838 [Cannabis sativa]
MAQQAAKPQQDHKKRRTNTKVTTVTTATNTREFKRAPTNLSQEESELTSVYAMVAIVLKLAEEEVSELRTETKMTTMNMHIETGVTILTISSPKESRIPSLPGSPRASFTISVTSLARPSFTISVTLLTPKSPKLKKSARLSTRTSFLLLMISDLFSPKSSLSDYNSKLQTVGVPHLSSLDAFVEARNTGRT